MRNGGRTVEEEGVGLGDDDEGEGDEEEADDEDQQPQPPRLLTEAPHQLRALPGLHLPSIPPLPATEREKDRV